MGSLERLPRRSQIRRRDNWLVNEPISFTLEAVKGVCPNTMARELLKRHDTQHLSTSAGDGVRDAAV
jgi:hypothetical protein